MIAFFGLIYLEELGIEKLDLGDSLMSFVVASLAFLTNIVLCVIGLIAKRKIKDESIKLNKMAFFTTIILILLSIIMMMIIPVLDEKITNQIIEKNAINYLNKKYGNNDFEVTDIEKAYSYNGIISSYHTGYELRISSSALEDKFDLRTYENNPLMISKYSEEFIEEYYKKDLLKKYHLEFDMWIDEEYIPDNCGHIPTFNELVDYGAISHIYTWIKNKNKYMYNVNPDETINNIKETMLDLIEYLNISRPAYFEFRGLDYNCDVKISDNILKIIINNKTYEFNIKNT